MEKIHIKDLKPALPALRKAVAKAGAVEVVGSTGSLCLVAKLDPDRALVAGAREISEAVLAKRSRALFHFASGGLSFLVYLRGVAYMIAPPEQRDPLLPRLDSVPPLKLPASTEAKPEAASPEISDLQRRVRDLEQFRSGLELAHALTRSRSRQRRGEEGTQLDLPLEAKEAPRTAPPARA